MQSSPTRSGTLWSALWGPDEARTAGTRLLGDRPEDVAGAAAVVKLLAGEIDTLLHAVGILAALPHILEPDEVVQAVSPAHDGAGVRVRNPGLPGGDLVTNLQVGEFTFMRWHAAKSNGVRQRKVVVDLIKLATAEVGNRRRVFYAAQGDLIRRWLGRSRGKVATRAADGHVMHLWETLGSPEHVTDLWAIVGPEGDPARRIEVVHLPDLVPELDGILPPA